MRKHSPECADKVCARAVTLSPHSGECFRIRNKPINKGITLKFLYVHLLPVVDGDQAQEIILETRGIVQAD